MKRIALFSTVIATAIITSGLTAFTLSKLSDKQEDRVTTKTDFPKVGNHFTSYSTDNYPDLTYAAENAVKAVVNIENIQKSEPQRYQQRGGYNPFFEFFGIPEEYGDGGGYQSQPRERRSGGSGVIISNDGYIVTNNHVVDKASVLKVRLSDNRSYEAKLIGTDPTTDVALIKIDATDLPTLVFGNSETLRLGEWVLAIGNPYDLQSTVTAGIISAKGRSLDVIPSQFSIESFIQTDAAVNPGNSGGALVNTKGELIGINTVIKSPTGSFAGYSFAVPTTIVKKVVTDLKEYGVVQRALLGIEFQKIDNGKIFDIDSRSEIDIDEQSGLYVANVIKNGAAEAAGVKKGDVITSIDGIKLDNSVSLQEYIATKRPGDNVNLELKRDGKVKQINITLRNRIGEEKMIKSDVVDVVAALGGRFGEISEKDKKNLKIGSGVRVIGVEQGGLLAKASIRSGYIITHINDKAVNSVSDLSRLSSKIRTIDGIYPDGRARGYSFVE